MTAVRYIIAVELTLESSLLLFLECDSYCTMENSISESKQHLITLGGFPSDFSDNDIREFLHLFDPSHVVVNADRRKARAYFLSADHAKGVMTLLQQHPLKGQTLTVQYATVNANESATNVCAVTRHSDIPDPVKRLYASAEHMNFTQPMPPYLKYQYPSVNRYIIDAISIALECSPKFYTQVLHLMNRMHMEPPFIAGAERPTYATMEEHIVRTDKQMVDVGVQTELSSHRKRNRLASGESELDSSDGSEADDNRRRNNEAKRQRMPDAELHNVRDKVRKMLRVQQIVGVNPTDKRPTTQATIDNLFDRTEIKSNDMKIVPQMTLPTAQVPNTTADSFSSEKSVTQIPQQPSTSLGPQLISDAELLENRIPPDQLLTHPLFQNYDAGSPSNKLYIKNIAKEVTDDDLKSVFHRYLNENFADGSNVRTIDIRLMTTGRMKGQAFVTFSGPYLDGDGYIDIVERARRDTNGLILKSKAIVVSYGKATPTNK